LADVTGAAAGVILTRLAVLARIRNAVGTFWLLGLDTARCVVCAIKIAAEIAAGESWDVVTFVAAGVWAITLLAILCLVVPVAQTDKTCLGDVLAIQTSYFAGAVELVEVKAGLRYGCAVAGLV